MFTGIIKAVGAVDRMQPAQGGARLAVSAGGIDWRAYEPGESIAVNGVCLTAVRLDERGFEADVSGETLSVTTLGGLTAGSRVNLEPALAVSERLGGHLVSGHVDCVGVVEARAVAGSSTGFHISVAPKYRRYLARKGSVCADGVSLTVNEVTAEGFSVNVVPHTAGVTTLGEWRAGTAVNIEVDLLARYLERLLSCEPGGALNKEFLKAHGYG